MSTTDESNLPGTDGRGGRTVEHTYREVPVVFMMGDPKRLLMHPEEFGKLILDGDDA